MIHIAGEQCNRVKQDLINIPEEKWVNMYVDDRHNSWFILGPGSHPNKEQAIAAVSPYVIDYGGTGKKYNYYNTVNITN